MPLEGIDIILFAASVVAMATLYSSVGHGGASGYLALMALFSFAPDTMKPIALTLNIFVSAASFWFFRKHHHFEWRLFLPFAIASVPASFVGGLIEIDPKLYKQILGIFMIIAVLRLLNLFGGETKQPKKVNIPLALILGASIGLFSGMIGIGGGIILSPLILFLGWGNVKQAAAVSALFIFVNSIAGFAGYSLDKEIIVIEGLLYVPIALLGGILGGVFGSTKMKAAHLRYTLALVLAVAGIKLFLF